VEGVAPELRPPSRLVLDAPPGRPDWATGASCSPGARGSGQPVGRLEKQDVVHLGGRPWRERERTSAPIALGAAPLRCSRICTNGFDGTAAPASNERVFMRHGDEGVAVCCQRSSGAGGASFMLPGRASPRRPAAPHWMELGAAHRQGGLQARPREARGGSECQTTCPTTRRVQGVDGATRSVRGAGRPSRPVRLAYQPPASSTFLSEQTSHQQPASRTFLSKQTSTSHQPPAKRTGSLDSTSGREGCRLPEWAARVRSCSALFIRNFGSAATVSIDAKHNHRVASCSAQCSVWVICAVIHGVAGVVGFTNCFAWQQKCSSKSMTTPMPMLSTRNFKIWPCLSLII
jgi:hypothetical protein